MSKNLPTDPLKGRTLYEQVRIVAKQRDWPDDAAHDAGNEAVAMCGDNLPCKTYGELRSVTSEALRTN